MAQLDVTILLFLNPYHYYWLSGLMMLLVEYCATLMYIHFMNAVVLCECAVIMVYFYMFIDHICTATCLIVV